MLLRQKYVTIVGAIDFYPESTKIRFVRPTFETPTNTITERLNVIQVRSRRFAATCIFCTAAVTYSWSFCGFFAITTVNNIS